MPIYSSHLFACITLQLEVHVNACCNVRKRIFIPMLHRIATRVEILLYALLVATRHKQNIVNWA